MCGQNNVARYIAAGYHKTSWHREAASLRHLANIVGYVDHVLWADGLYEAYIMCA